jgi:hypothetical protein
MFDIIELLSKVVSIITGLITIANFSKGKNVGFWLFMFILSCFTIFYVSKFTKSSEKTQSEKPIIKYEDYESVDGDFSKFRIKFYEDYAFQISRIKFPLKTGFYADMESQKPKLLTQDGWHDYFIIFNKIYNRSCPKIADNMTCFYDVKFYKNNTTATECFADGSGEATECAYALTFEKVDERWFLITLD